MADNALARGDWSTTSLRKQYGDEPLNALAAGVPMGDVASAWPGQYGDAVPQPNALMRFMASPQGQQLNILASFLGPRISAPKAAPLRPQPERPSTFYHSTSRDYNPSALKYDGGVASGIFASPDKEFSSGFGARTTEYKLAPGKYFDFRDPEHLKLLDPAKLWPDAVPEARRVWMNNVRRGEWSQMERGPVRQAIEDAGYDGMWLSHTMPDKRASRMNDTMLAWRDGSFVEPTTVRVPEGPGSASPQGIRAYHGTYADFDNFTPRNSLGPHFGTPEHATNILGRDEIESGARVIPVNLKFNKTLEVTDHSNWTPSSVARELELSYPELAGKLLPKLTGLERGHSAYSMQNQNTAELRSALLEHGVDALKYPNRYEGEGEWSYIALRPGTVTSATTGDQLYRILRKYGLLPPAALGAASMASQSNQEQ